ncbi:MAG: L-histidine N-alpha-methyltransferase [Cryomorphaceae bacterium]|jgi:L-histidine N-alpha-methyltransferase
MTFLDQFMIDVDLGLSGSPKSLSSKYFYDKRGSELFVEIMNLPEYYLSRSEMEIFTLQSDRLIELFEIQTDHHVELIELGPGDGRKILHLLLAMTEQKYDLSYFPVDISEDSLKQLEAMLAKELPALSVRSHHGDYFDVLSSLKQRLHKKIVFFLGSNLGNYPDQQAADFVYQLGSNMHPGDILVLGLDLKKPSEQVLPAYNDKDGVTRDFNFNLLSRINRELGANFSLDAFAHRPEYCEQTGVASSYLESLADQQVSIDKLAKTFQFQKGEKIQLEISRKYSDEVFNDIIAKSDFQIIGKVLDEKQYFAEYILCRE